MSTQSTPEGPGSVSGAPNLPEGFAETTEWLNSEPLGPAWHTAWTSTRSAVFEVGGAK